MSPKAGMQKVKTRKSIKLSKANQTKLQAALDLARSHYAPLAAVWHGLTIDQRDSVLSGSPILAGILAFADQFPRGV